MSQHVLFFKINASCSPITMVEKSYRVFVTTPELNKSPGASDISHAFDVAVGGINAIDPIEAGKYGCYQQAEFTSGILTNPKTIVEKAIYEKDGWRAFDGGVT